MFRDAFERTRGQLSDLLPRIPSGLRPEFAQAIADLELQLQADGVFRLREQELGTIEAAEHLVTASRDIAAALKTRVDALDRRDEIGDLARLLPAPTARARDPGHQCAGRRHAGSARGDRRGGRRAECRAGTGPAAGAGRPRTAREGAHESGHQRPDALDGGGRISVTTAAAGDDAVEVAVEDTGRGIPADVLERVCEPFFTTKAPGKGSGLGLSMVSGFARQSGGEMRIESRVGEGTTVRIRLPVAETSASVSEHIADAARSTIHPDRGGGCRAARCRACGVATAPSAPRPRRPSCRRTDDPPPAETRCAVARPRRPVIHRWST
nr:ATP-binding protein [Thiocapsa sp.]